MKKLNTKIFLLLALLSFASCSDWLNIEPDGQATNDKLTETGDGYRTMLSGIYKAMTSANLYGTELQFGIVDCISRQYSWNWYMNASDSKTDHMEAYNFNYYDINLRKKIDAIWKDGYNVIANANNLIQSLQTEKNVDKFSDGEMERDLILGEAYACRAMMHFDLCRLFAPAPVENETGNYLPYVENYPNIQPNGIDVPTFLGKVVDDLKKAQDLTAHFDTTALGMTVSASSGARFYEKFNDGMEGAANPQLIDAFYKGRGYRLNYYSITALLARVYQYMGEDELAYDCADKVMSFKVKNLQGNESEMFTSEDWYSIQEAGDDNERRKDLKVASTLIFALYNGDAYEDYGLNRYFNKLSENDLGNPDWLALDLEGQEIFKNATTGEDESDGDFRSKYLLFSPNYHAFLDGKYRLSGKWYCSDDKTLRDENMQLLPIIRTTEMYYIMAEHKARINDFEGAYQILRKIRENRGLYEWDFPLATQMSLEGFLKDMIRDAQREWISEGQLFYLYKRLGAKLKIGNQIRKYNKSEYMLPIPDNQNM